MRHLQISAKPTQRQTESFKQYLKEISEIQPMTNDEETMYAQRAANGDKEAMNELVRRNLRFVISVAKHYSSTQTPLEDLVNEGNIGLIEASERFKPDMGFKFITYAVWWIRKNIMNYLSDNGRMVRLPTNKIQALARLEKNLNSLEHQNNTNVSLMEALVAQDEIKEADHELMNLIGQYHMDSLDRELSGDDGSGSTLSEMIGDNSSEQDLFDTMENSDMRTYLTNIISKFNERDQIVINNLYGLDGSYPKQLSDVADMVGVSREMVRQIRDKALLKIKVRIKTNPL